MKTYNIVQSENCKITATIEENYNLTITEENSYQNFKELIYKNIDIKSIKLIDYSKQIISSYKRHTTLFALLTIIILSIALLISIFTKINTMTISIISIIIAIIFVVLMFIKFPNRENTTNFNITTDTEVILYESNSENYNLTEIKELVKQINILKNQ